MLVEVSSFLGKRLRGFLVFAGEKICIARLYIAIKGAPWLHPEAKQISFQVFISMQSWVASWLHSLVLYDTLWKD